MLVRTWRKAAIGRGTKLLLRLRWRSAWRLLRLAAAAVAFSAPWALQLDAAEPTQPMGIVSRIERHPVQSRALAAIGYSNRLRALEVEFKRGGTYRYLEVPRAVYNGLLAADSKAGFYNRNVRGKFRSVYVRPRRKR